MFEIEVQTPRHIRLRVGRWHFRTWRSAVMRLPKGYVSPESVYEVVLLDETGEHVDVQFAAFFSEAPALKLIERLVADGYVRDRLVVSLMPVHERLEDYEWDR